METSTLHAGGIAAEAARDAANYGLLGVAAAGGVGAAAFP
jgi:hypothetical protein